MTLRRGAKEILCGIDLEVRAGEHWAVLGPNGAGKSTVLSLCGANQHPTSGTVRVLGHQLGRIDVQSLRRLIGHVNPRHTLHSPLTVEQVVLTGLTGTADLPRRWEPAADELALTHELLAQVGMGAKAQERWPTLSQGERGRVLIARALVGRPRLLLLDEPTTGLDLAAREQLLTAIDDVVTERPDTATVLVTHHLEELPRSTSHAALVRDGRLTAAGPIDEALTSAAVSEAFDHPIEVHRTAGRWHASAGERAARVG
ncbi:ABC transporter ATP-binding protein [Nocardioides sp. ChNu-153]|uniref:ABC transporter ATP-binding protein n=1 Tax=Nocardioides sp. ChNu-153 TaxID=2779364 RepID=UPI00265AF8F6|nr:ATP-binding cassette domain-containing protein [Nocardioides sp. ChNu-153]